MGYDTMSSAHNLQREWRECCQKALGYELFDDCTSNSSNEEEEKKEEGGAVVLLSFIDDDDDEVESKHRHVDDAWMENANRINDSLIKITEILERKKDSFAQPHQTEEASLLESTILSFVAATANQIEALRQGISSSNRDYIHHCGGIVAYLLAMLKEEIANPFAKLQKQRARPAMALWDNPLQCQLVSRTSSDPLDDEDDQEKRFMPTARSPLMVVPIVDFLEKYDQKDCFSQDDLKRPTSIFAPTSTSASPDADSTNEKPDSRKAKKEQEIRLPYQQQQGQQDPQQEEEDYNNILHQEAVLLTATLQNDLDSVQQVEARMTEITSLLGQFSNLVSDQQAEIESIHVTTVKSHENVSKGQDHLVDAAERTKQSKHYMAGLVCFLALLLLFFNYITP
eukprot:CAMPEP_0119004198 /NCGR_PEP_ID=MMETSP1176-20130426/1011_1 /TAXON_ID=265551 /ORGANISM="Synedropsis recta cf, Strain CCMP1620" /LENGTH=396 /DNA_ID=CAMNT_0006955879 /DNA_START=75 /DNA_END=1265 /DNA_ORIENTATION=+